MDETSPDRIADAAASLERRVAATIADMRGRRGLTKAELAALLGVPAERVAGLESGAAGHVASLATLAEIAHRLDFHVTLGLHDRQPPATGEKADSTDRQNILTDLSSSAALSIPALGDAADLGSALDVFAAGDIGFAPPEEPGHTFLLDEPAPGMGASRPSDETLSPSGDGDHGFGDGMGT